LAITGYVSFAKLTWYSLHFSSCYNSFTDFPNEKAHAGCRPSLDMGMIVRSDKGGFLPPYLPTQLSENTLYLAYRQVKVLCSNLEGCSKQKWTANALSFKNPTGDC